jgi:hypothetical protein
LCEKHFQPLRNQQALLMGVTIPIDNFVAKTFAATANTVANAGGANSHTGSFYGF